MTGLVMVRSIKRDTLSIVHAIFVLDVVMHAQAKDLLSSDYYLLGEASKVKILNIFVTGFCLFIFRKSVYGHRWCIGRRRSLPLDHFDS